MKPGAKPIGKQLLVQILKLFVVVMAERSFVSGLCISIVSCDARQPVEGSVCGLRIPNRLLFEWHKQVGQARAAESWIEKVNSTIVDQAITLDVHCERLKRQIARKAGTIFKNMAKLRGGARMKQLNGNTVFTVCTEETVSIASHE